MKKYCSHFVQNFSTYTRVYTESKKNQCCPNFHKARDSFFSKLSSKRGITTTGHTSTRKRGITSTLCWEPFPWFKIFFFGQTLFGGLFSSKQNNFPPPPTSRGLGGGLKPKQTPFSHFFHKIGSRVRTRGIIGSGGVSKNQGPLGLPP